MRYFKTKPTGRPPKWTAEALELALSKYAAGETTVRCVRRDFGIPPTTLLRYCRERGIPIRDSGLSGVKGEQHPTWKGGFRIDRDGYVRTYAPGHPWPRRGRYVLEHVRVMELAIGRRLFPGEVVHHRDEDKQNNALSNLELIAHGKHSSLHRHEDTHLRKRDPRTGKFA